MTAKRHDIIMRMTKPYMIQGMIVAVLAIALDQLCKWWLLDIFQIANRPPVEVTPFFNLVMVWNYGISFGLFASHQQPLLLTAMALLIVAILLVWLAKVDNRSEMWGIGLVIGGALGNVIDRVRFGAVADFFDAHAFGYHWPAFNIADSCIFIGVVVLCIRSIMHSPKEGQD